MIKWKSIKITINGFKCRIIEGGGWVIAKPRERSYPLEGMGFENDPYRNFKEISRHIVEKLEVETWNGGGF